MRYLATTTTLTQESHFFSDKAVRAKANHYTHLRKRLQHKGTRSAKKRMTALSGRERRLKLNTNHFIAKTIVKAHPHSLIGLEALTGIRERKSWRKRRRRGKKVLPLTPKQRRANYQAFKWAFAELQSIIDYKAALSNSMAVQEMQTDGRLRVEVMGTNLLNSFSASRYRWCYKTAVFLL